MGKPRSRWEQAVWRDAVDSLEAELEGGRKGEKILEEGDRGGHDPRKEIGEAMARKLAEVDRNAIQKEEAEERGAGMAPYMPRLWAG